MAQATTPSSAEMLRTLVAFDTTSSRSNLPLIDHVAGFLAAHRVEHRIIAAPDGVRANLHAVIGPGGSGGIALSGHVDTVPVDGQEWTASPFELRRDAGRLYGRGTADMKGFVACCLAAVPMLMAARLTRPIHLFITYDEEVDCAGARRLIEQLDRERRPELCIVGEPSGMQPITAHKGKLSVRVAVRGRAGHSSQPARGVNAIFAASQAVAWLASEAARHAADGPFAEGFDPAHTTVHVGTMSGGTIQNIIPQDAHFVIEWRSIPAALGGGDPAAGLHALRAHVARHIEPAMHAVDPGCGFRFEVLDELPAMALADDHPLASLVRQATGANATGRVSYGTEGGLYQNAGIPTIVCGPGHIAQAHQPDEWIAESELTACDAFIRALSVRLAA